ncbi:MAG: alkaline phosphatase family protein, partial [Candidatus Cybelea sp.]
MGVNNGGLTRAASILFAITSLWLWSGCAPVGGGSFSSGRGSAVRTDLSSMSKISKHISHIVVIVQENRSFENFFAGYPGANAPMNGCGKGSAVAPGTGSGSSCPPGEQVIPLHQVTFEHEPNLAHVFESSLTDWDNGKMDGFSKYGFNHDDAAYAYIERSQVQTYWTMANQYVLADEMFPTEFGPSWTAHLTLVAGTDNITPTTALADFATGHSNCGAAPGTMTAIVDEKRVVHHDSGPFPCLDQFNTIAQALDTAGVSWKYYVAAHLKSFIWSPFAAIKYVQQGPDWTNNVIQPQTQVLKDIYSGNLASVSWVTPSHKDSDHPGAHSDTGPAWVASVVNAIGQSPYWSSTAIVVVWDDYGGFYDNAPPPQLDFRGLGIRVPCLIISPYAKPGLVSHKTYEFGSILKLIEEAFPTVGKLGLPSQGYTDTRA